MGREESKPMIEGYQSQTRLALERGLRIGGRSFVGGPSGDRLVERLSNFAGIEVDLETPDTGLAKARDFLREAKSFVHSLEGIAVSALWGSTSWTAE